MDFEDQFYFSRWSFKLIFYFLAKITEVKIEPTNRANKEFCMHGFSINTSEKEASPL